MKPAAVSVTDISAQAAPAATFLRIAVPAWRSAGVNWDGNRECARKLSREEVQALFHGELTGRGGRRSKLTDREEQQRELARQIRLALYPHSRAQFHH